MEKTFLNRYKTELKRLNFLFANCDKETLELITPLLENGAFMRVALEELQREVQGKGFTDEYQNGKNQKGLKIGASLQAYNTTLKNYNVLISRLSKYLPEGTEKDDLEEFLDR